MTSIDVEGGSEGGVVVLRRVDDVLAAATAWDGLPSRTGIVGGTAWTRAWLEVFGPRHRLAVGVAGSPGQPRAVLPLVGSSRRPWVWEMLGVRQLYEATDLRGADPSAVAAVVVAMAGLPVRLRRLPADSPLLAHLPLVRERGALVRTLPVVGTPTISLDERWTEPEHHFSSRRRSDLRVARRRAEALGEVTISVEEPAPGTVGPLFDEAVAVEAAGWKRRAATALAVQPRPRAFFRRLCELAAEQGVLRLAFLRIGGRPAAVQIAAEQHGRYSLFKIGFDEQFARCSPGNLLLLYSVRRAAELGLRSFDFLGAAEPWTALWTTEVRPCIDLSVYPRSPWSPLAAGEDAARATAKWVLARRRQPAG